MSSGSGGVENDNDERRQLLEERLERMLLRGDDADADDNDSQQDEGQGRGGLEGEGWRAANDVPGNNNDFGAGQGGPHDDAGARNNPAVDPVVGAAAAAAGEPGLNNDNMMMMMMMGREPNSRHRSTGLSYVHASFLAAIAWFYYAMRTRQQFYLAVVYLASSKLSLAVMGNACIALAVAAFETFVSVFLDGGLRLQEAEGLQDFFRWNVTETCLALTMFRSEITIQTTVEFLVLIWIKCVHHVAGLRENHFRMTQEAVTSKPVFGGRLHVPTIPKPFVKLFVLLLFLQVLDVAVFQHASDSLNQNGPSVNILFKFETIILLVAAWRHALLLHLHLWDGLLQHAHDHSWIIARRLLHPWKEYRATLVFAVELQAQAFQFLFYVAFFGTVLTYYGMPINLFREVYLSFAALRERVLAFLKYRKLMGRMNRFDNATNDKLEEAGHVCIICRDDMHPRDSKVLPGCNHIFHKSCLREWLVQQQTCPTCRSDIDEMARRQAQRQEAAQVAEGRREAGGGPAEDAAAATEVPPPPPPPEEPRPEGAAPEGGDATAAATVETTSAAAAAAAGAAGLTAPTLPSFPASSCEAGRTEGLSPPPAARRRPNRLSRTVSPTDTLLGRSSEPLPSSVPLPIASRPSWNFPCLYRVVAPVATAVWRMDDDKLEDSKVESAEEEKILLGSSSDRPRRDDLVRHLRRGTVVLCTAVAVDADGALYLRVPDGWVSQEDVAHVADVGALTAAHR